MPHLLHEMKTSRVPRRYVFFDTEAHRRSKGGTETQTWRLGVTCEINWDSYGKKWSRPIFTDHETPESLWATITAAARATGRTVVVAHNLGYDLLISRGFVYLPALGWNFEHFSLTPTHVSFDAVKGPCKLVFVDSTSVLPVSLERLGELLGIEKPKLPVEHDPDAAWWERCRVDTQILAGAYLIVVDALRNKDLGTWGRTGAGIGWNTLIRRHLSDTVLVHGIEDVREIERGAIYGGRSEAWQWGRLKRDRWHEWDYELAYGNVCSQEILPAYYDALSIGATMKHVRNSYPNTRWLINANVCTDLPLLPMKDEHGVFFPTGEFTGWWWDVELMNAEAQGATISPIQAHKYQGKGFMQTWANWIIDLCADQSSPEAKVLAVAAKQWQRSVPGRSAMRYRKFTEVGDAWRTDVSYMPMYDYDREILGAVFQAAGRRWEAWERTWWDSALPQVLSAVSAHCRVSLWRAMRVAGLDHVAYVDTDSLIVDDEGSEALRKATLAGELGSLREKATLSRLDVWAPRYVTSSHFTRIAGISGDRKKTGEHKYVSSAWERLPEALANGNTDRVIVRRQVSKLLVEDWHRLHLPGGLTRAYQVLDGMRETPETKAG